MRLDEYARGERHRGWPTQANPGFSNCDPFLRGFVEPQYDPHFFCNNPPHWENAACIPAGDLRRTVAASAGMMIAVEHVNKPASGGHPALEGHFLSTCSVTLVQPDVVLTAGHCLNPEDVPSVSVIFGYQTDCAGLRPAGYAPRFYKVKRLIKLRFEGNYDYCLMQLKEPVVGVTPIVMRPDLPALGEQVFCIHHPNGSVKKLSRPRADGFATVSSSGPFGVFCQLDVSGGSSGSGLFDMAGRVVGTLASGKCTLGWFPTQTVLQEMSAPPATEARDVMIVFDRSGSMSENAGGALTKMREAQDAAAMFVQMVRASGGNRVGLVSFSTSASLNFALAPVTPASKNTLIGAAPFTGGMVGGLTTGGTTSIGGGLDAARSQLTPAGTNPRAILLLTDGMENQPPLSNAIAPLLSGIKLNIVGYGTEATLDGPKLAALAGAQGRYVLAPDGLQVRKFFAHAFGNIFEAGTLGDPEFVLASNENSAAPMSFDVCGEEAITVVIGWDHPSEHLSVALETPAGASVTSGSAGVESAAGRTWAFLRVPLPHSSERDGRWKVKVSRGFGQRVAASAPLTLRYFVNVLALGGPRLERVILRRRYYTGDAFNPLVTLSYAEGGHPEDASATVTITRPAQSLGSVLAIERLGAPVTVDGDVIPARQSTLRAIEARTGQPAVTYTRQTLALLDRPEATEHSMGHGGIFGLPMTDLFNVEGHFTFQVKAGYGRNCRATRELFFSVQVDTSVDPARTGIVTSVVRTRPDGRRDVQIVLTPRDRFGNVVGPGRGDSLGPSGHTGTTLTGPLVDNGDGTYTTPGIWDASTGQPPGVVFTQPDRPPTVLPDPEFPTEDGRGSLVVKFVDPTGSPVRDFADIFLAHHTLSDRRDIRSFATERRLVVRDLISTHTGIYSVQVLPNRHRAVAQFVTIRDGEVTRITMKLQ